MPPNSPNNESDRRFSAEGSSLGSENQASALGRRKRASDDTDGDHIWALGRKKRPTRTDPLVHHGRHFGRTIRAFCRVQALIKDGLSLDVQIELGDVTVEDLSEDVLKEYRIYQQLLSLSPKLEERLCTGSEQEIFHVADMITRGASNARSDDTRTLKSAVIDWITPPDTVLRPPLQRNVKTDRGFHHSRTGELLCPATMNWKSPEVRERLRSAQLVPSGEQWPLFLYHNYEYNPDDPWNGLLRSELLVKAYKHIFTSPSSVEKSAERPSTRSSNSSLHGMTSVTKASLCYIATQVRFAISSTAVFSRSDTTTDSERFYNSLMTLLEDAEERDEVKRLMAWWDR
ncbi:hypothetical protein BKA70DRAFT_1373300 [Coprinopsis sp. MPI-PUGE-AT-0042]|nr:hypothetical protein BKA70DRAFT_1373300 [Coprinopsis sp. MPI-PUGE-AT-0042]